MKALADALKSSKGSLVSYNKTKRLYYIGLDGNPGSDAPVQEALAAHNE